MKINNTKRSDKAIIFTDEEMRLMVLALSVYEETVMKKIESKKSQGVTNLFEMLELKKQVSDKIWGAR